MIDYLDPRIKPAIANWLKDHGILTFNDRYTIAERLGVTIGEVDTAIEEYRTRIILPLAIHIPG